MSPFTKRVLQSINYTKIKSKRRENFLKMHQLLLNYNQFPVNINSQTHMYYPFMYKQENLRYKLIEKKLYNPFWWKHVLDLVPDDCIEYYLSKYTIMLPIDQRYSLDDISMISQIVLSSIK